MKFLIRAALAALMSVAVMSVVAVAMAAPPAHAAETFKYTIFQSPPQELNPTDFCYHLALPQYPIISARNDTTTFIAVMGTGADCSDFHQVGPPLGTTDSRNYTLEERVVMVRFLF